VTHDDTEPDKGGRADLEELAARCATWLVQERDRMERELRSAYRQSDDLPRAGVTGVTGMPGVTGMGQVTPPAPVSPKRPPVARPAAPAAAAPLIGLLDRLAELPADPGFRDSPDSLDSPDGARPDPVLAWVRRTVLAALAASGVTPVDDSGPVDPARHNIVATRDDPSGRHCGAIAETVRPGYVWGEELLRHQEVVAYVPPEQQTAARGPVSEPSEEGGPPHDVPH